jgi:predicted nucleic acid-binding protein
LIVHLDTSALVDALCGPFRSLPQLHAIVAAGDRTAISSPVLYEWLRGPRRDAELRVQEQLLPASEAVPFDTDAARTAAAVYRSLRRSRGREVDIMIAACAIEHDAVLWTLNPEDFDDVPGLRLYRPAG